MKNEPHSLCSLPKVSLGAAPDDGQLTVDAPRGGQVPCRPAGGRWTAWAGAAAGASLADGRALVTVARTWGSAPRPAGAWMALRDDGRVQGSVSGGCIEDDLIRPHAGGRHRRQPARVLRYGVTPTRRTASACPVAAPWSWWSSRRRTPPCWPIWPSASRAASWCIGGWRWPTGEVQSRGGPAGDSPAVGRRAPGHPARPPLAPADHWRRADFPLPGDDGPGAGLSRSTVCDPRRSTPTEWDVPGAPARGRHARRRGERA
jgi:xanthine dehydrogenase accessory factor